MIRFAATIASYLSRGEPHAARSPRKGKGDVMRFPGIVWRGFGLFLLGVSLLGHAAPQASGQVTTFSHSPESPSSTANQSQSSHLEFVENSFPNAVIGVPFHSSIQAAGGSGLLAFTVTGDLPPGLVFQTGANTVAVSGEPTETGEYTFEISAKDDSGNSLQSDFTIHVLAIVPGGLATRSTNILDQEAMTLTDTDDAFFPIVILDNENFNFTDSVAAFLPLKILDNENFNFTDSVSSLDSVDIVDNESFSFSDTITVALLRVPKITWTAPAPITYGTPLSATQLDATSTTVGTFAYTPPAGTVLPAGQQTLSVTLTPTDSTAFGAATATVMLTVNQAAQSITFTPPASPVTYPLSSPITLVATGGASGNPVTFSVLSGPATVSGVNGSILTITGAGTVVIAANQAGNTNYTAAPQATQSIVVNPPVIAVLTSPTPGLSTKLGTTNVTFQWTTGTNVTEYQLNLSAIAPGASDLFLYKGTATSAIAATLPANAVEVYATLYSKINGVWLSNSYVYTESGTPTPATLTSPAPGLGTILGATNVIFKWSAGLAVTEYQLNLSAIASGDSDLYLYKGTALTTTVPTLPANGVKVYATLYSKINGVWQSNDYVYTESGTPTPATLTSPTPGISTILGTSNVVFQWTAGIAVSDYQLNLSAIAPGDSDLYLYKGTALTTTVPDLPANGVKVYARLYSDVNGSWQSNDYVYTESGTLTLAVLTSPTPGLSTILGASNVTFQWTAGIDVTDYQLNLSAIAPGDSDLFVYKGTALTATAPTLPANGVKVYARLYSDIDGTWQYNDYVYTEQ
jgi:hypothetical protein